MSPTGTWDTFSCGGSSAGHVTCYPFWLWCGNILSLGLSQQLYLRLRDPYSLHVVMYLPLLLLLHSFYFRPKRVTEALHLRAFDRYMVRVPCYIKPTHLLVVVTVFISWRLKIYELLGLVLQRPLCGTTLCFPFRVQLSLSELLNYCLHHCWTGFPLCIDWGLVEVLTRIQ